MNSSLWSADVITHTKIVAVSLMAATAVVVVGISAQISNTNLPGNGAGGPAVIKASDPAAFSATNISMIR